MLKVMPIKLQVQCIVHYQKLSCPVFFSFLGILLAVAALESLGLLFHFAEDLNATIPNTDIVVSLLGIASAVIDNVPLVAASMGMFSMPPDDPIWHLDCLLCWYWWEYAYSRVCCRCSCHGYGKN